MTDERNGMDLQTVYDRLTRLEARGEARDERMQRMEAALQTMTAQLETMSNDLRDAKTGLRIGLWISTTFVPAGAALAGWISHHFWTVK